MWCVVCLYDMPAILIHVCRFFEAQNNPENIPVTYVVFPVFDTRRGVKAHVNGPTLDPADVRAAYICTKTVLLGTHLGYQDGLPLPNPRLSAVHASCTQILRLSAAADDDMDECGARTDDMAALEKDGLCCGSQETALTGSIFRRSSGCQQQSLASPSVTHVSVTPPPFLLPGFLHCQHPVSLPAVNAWSSKTHYVHMLPGRAAHVPSIPNVRLFSLSRRVAHPSSGPPRRSSPIPLSRRGGLRAPSSAQASAAAAAASSWPGRHHAV